MEPDRTAARLRRLPRERVLGRDVRVASAARARLLGLAYLDREAAGAGLLIPRCASVHTFGMRFELDLFFLGAAGAVLGARWRVPPRRVAWQRSASAVLELPSAMGGEFAGPRT